MKRKKVKKAATPEKRLAEIQRLVNQKSSMLSDLDDQYRDLEDKFNGIVADIDEVQRQMGKRSREEETRAIKDASRIAVRDYVSAMENVPHPKAHPSIQDEIGRILCVTFSSIRDLVK